MRKLPALLIFLILFTIPAIAQNIKVAGIASKGGKIVRTSAQVQHTLMETYPACTITVYLTGTLTLATIFSDEIGSPRANPFTANTDASWFFYVAEGRYDIKFSGTGIIVPFTLSDVFVEATGGGGGGSVTSVFGRDGVVVAQNGDYDFNQLDFTGSSLASLETRSATDLTSGTLPDARFPATLPAISGANLTNLNATNITSGTLNDARLSVNVPLKNTANTFSLNNIFTASVGINTSTPRRRLDVLDGANAQIRLSAVDNTTYTDLFVDSGGTLNIIPTGNVTFDSSGNQVNPLNNFDQNLGQINKKWLSLHAAELFVETLVAQNTIATIGGRIIVAPSNILIADFPNAATTINVKYNNLNNGDRIYMEGNSSVEFMAITSGASVIPGGFSYTVTRNLDGTGANDWFAGDALVNTGVSGNGFIDLYSLRGVKSSSQVGPTIVGNVRNSITFNDWTERWAIGNLNGLFGYASDTYGAAFGIPTGAWIKIDPTNGVRIGHNTTTKTQIDASGNATFSGTITATAGNIANWTINANSLSSSSTYIASSFDPPAGQISWFGKSATGFQGMILRDSSGRFINAIVGGTAPSFPFLSMNDGTFYRFVAGGLNDTFNGGPSVNSMGVKIWNSSGGLLAEFSDSDNKMGGWGISTTTISSTGINIVSGVSAHLAFGTTPPTSASNGTGIFLDRTGLYGILSNVVQIKVDATTGAIIAGASKVTLDGNGLSVVAEDNNPSRIKWTHANIFNSSISSYDNGGPQIMDQRIVASGSTNPSHFSLLSSSQSGGTGTNLILYSKPADSAAFAHFSGTLFKGVGIGISLESPQPAPVAMLETYSSDATDTILSGSSLARWRTSGTPSSGIGIGQLHRIETASFVMRDAARIASIWTTATDASRTSAIIFQTVSGAGALTETFRIAQGGIQIWDGSSMQTITFDAADSCGSGFRCLRIPN